MLTYIVKILHATPRDDQTGQAQKFTESLVTVDKYQLLWNGEIGECLISFHLLAQLQLVRAPSLAYSKFSHCE